MAWALEHETESPYTQGRLGQLRLSQGRFAEAEATFRQAAAQDEQEWLGSVALALLGQGRSEEALATLDRWLEQAKARQWRETLRWLAVVLRHAPQVPGVEACRRRLVGHE
ncbi:MAG: hypothetical protein ACE5F6_09260 [Anaerolineae bacterium]